MQSNKLHKKGVKKGPETNLSEQERKAHWNSESVIAMCTTVEEIYNIIEVLSLASTEEHVRV